MIVKLLMHCSWTAVERAMQQHCSWQELQFSKTQKHAQPTLRCSSWSHANKAGSSP
jgi:hypothetical protein